MRLNNASTCTDALTHDEWSQYGQSAAVLACRCTAPKACDTCLLQGVAYWSWNVNSGDTGGIVNTDWLQILFYKVNWMISATGMRPWYLGTAPVSHHLHFAGITMSNT